MEKFRNAYQEEAKELIAEIEMALLDLSGDKTQEEAELVDHIFRSMHTIKGSGAMFGFDDVVEVAHEMETILDELRSGVLPITREFVNLALSACDHIKKMIRSEGNDPDFSSDLISKFKAMRPKLDLPPPKDPLADAPTYRIWFHPILEGFKDGTNHLLLLDDLRTLGKCRITADIQKIPELKNLNPELCYIGWEIFLTTEKGLNDINGVFIFAEEKSQLTIELVNKSPKPDLPKKIPDQTHEKKSASPTVRVSADKLDELADLVGELVTLQASLSQRAALINDPEMVSVAERMERLTDDLRDNTISIRMVPIRSSFALFRRLIHDLSEKMGKSVEMNMQGESTELDKNIIEHLYDPFVHLIRNSISHGIETPEKKKTGRKAG